MKISDRYRTHPVLDTQRLVRVSGGDYNLIQMLIAGFSTDIQAQLKALEESYAGLNMEQQHASLHKMKGAVSNMGGTRLQMLLHEMVLSLRQQEGVLSEENVVEIGTQTLELLKEMKECPWQDMQG